MPMTYLAVFCIRLACGMAGVTLLVSPAEFNPRFFRSQCWTVLGLLALALAALLSVQSRWFDHPWLKASLVVGLVTATLGSIVWSLEGAPGGRWLGTATFVTLLAANGLTLPLLAPASENTALSASTRPWLRTAGEQYLSAALLGTSFTAMLLGHSYLVAPSTAIAPLQRLLLAVFTALAVRFLIWAGLVAENWSALGELGRLEHGWYVETAGEAVVRFAGPLILTFMAWRCACMRSTQSATGILYVLVVLCFLGEATTLGY